ncbi:hypothetical protein [uncultured Roseobacter sp.]|uniref:hypothetical protein n=1 Tax=uncultured Roseobacter sp. TaxID=114847 RepID=UPI0026292426|nr:hypothetical protein [uncultured Roseobacter sp.]
MIGPAGDLAKAAAIKTAIKAVANIKTRIKNSLCKTLKIGLESVIKARRVVAQRAVFRSKTDLCRIAGSSNDWTVLALRSVILFTLRED